MTVLIGRSVERGVLVLRGCRGCRGVYIERVLYCVERGVLVLRGCCVVLCCDDV